MYSPGPSLHALKLCCGSIMHERNSTVRLGSVPVHMGKGRSRNVSVAMTGLLSKLYIGL